MRLTWVAAAGLAAVGCCGAAAAMAAPQAGLSLAAITAVVAFVAAVQTAAVAIVGEYVVRAYREAQGRPSWVVRRTLGRERATTGSSRATRRRPRDPRAA
jgi:hypothetical protein